MKHFLKALFFLKILNEDKTLVSSIPYTRF